MCELYYIQSQNPFATGHTYHSVGENFNMLITAPCNTEKRFLQYAFASELLENYEEMLPRYYKYLLGYD